MEKLYAKPFCDEEISLGLSLQKLACLPEAKYNC